MRRHDALRSVFSGDSASARFEVQAEAPATQVIAVDSMPDGDGELWQLGPPRIRPDREPCFRAAVITDGTEHALLIRSHQFVMDGTSLAVVARDISRQYRGEAGTPPAASYADFAMWQRNWLDGPARDAFRQYWQRELCGANRLPLPCQDKRVLTGDLRTSTVTAAVSRECAAGIAAIRRDGFSVHTIAVGAFAITAARMYGVPDVVTGSPTANRVLPEFASMAGFSRTAS